MYTDEPALSPVGFSSLTSATVRAMHRDTGDTMPVTSSPNLSKTLSMNCGCCSGICEVGYKPLAKPKLMQANLLCEICCSTFQRKKNFQVDPITKAFLDRLATKALTASITMHKNAGVLLTSSCGGQHLLAYMYDAHDPHIP